MPELQPDDEPGRDSRPENVGDIREYYLARVKLTDDGRLANVSFELFALAQADDLDPISSWRYARGEMVKKPKSWSNSDSYRRRVGQVPMFIERVRVLREERSEVLKDAQYGEAKWAAMTTYRVARETNDVAVMVKSADLLFKIAEKQGGEGPVSEATTGKVGRPNNPTPLVTNDRSALRDKLTKMRSEA